MKNEKCSHTAILTFGECGQFMIYFQFTDQFIVVNWVSFLFCFLFFAMFSLFEVPVFKNFFAMKTHFEMHLSNRLFYERSK